MIIDQLANADLYRGLDQRLVQALDFLRRTDVSQLSVGRHEIDGDRLFALVQEYETKPMEQCAWEAHRKYWDVQFIVSGIERIGFANIEHMRVKQPYDADKDLEFFDGSGDLLAFHAGMFAIFSPHDVHMPAVAADGPSLIRKILVKARVGQ